MAQPALKVEGVSKRFPGTVALDGVGFEVAPGSFHALLGGNGSGKSTMIKVLAGVLSADPGGTLAVGGERISAERATPNWARSAGVRFVHQDLGLFEPLSVAENIALSAGFATSGGCVRWPAVRRHTAELLANVDLDVSPQATVASLSPAQRTLVAIARALDSRGGEPRLLVLDEPTARLPDDEVEILLEKLRQLTAAGTTVLYVSHRLGEVLQAADAVTVLRDGHHVTTRPVAGLDEQALVELIVGKPLGAIFSEKGAASSPAAGDREDRPVVAVAGLSGGAVRGVDIEVQPGEILGIGGTVGAGRSSLLRLLFGDIARTGGDVRLEGEPVDPRSPAAAMRLGVAYVPENRARDAAFLPLGVTENLSAATVRRYRRGGCLRRARERHDARLDMAGLRIRAASASAPLQSLSGGNQQKVVLARWMRLETRLLLLDEPTQGVDVGARAEIYSLIQAAAKEGLAVIVATSDFEELVGVSDRVLVMAEGRIVAEARPPKATADWVAHHTHAATVGTGR